MHAALFPGKAAPEKRPVTPNDKKWPQFWKFRVIYSEMAQSRRPGWDKPEIPPHGRKSETAKCTPSPVTAQLSLQFFCRGVTVENRNGVHMCDLALAGSTFRGYFLGELFVVLGTLSGLLGEEACPTRRGSNADEGKPAEACIRRWHCTGTGAFSRSAPVSRSTSWLQ